SPIKRKDVDSHRPSKSVERAAAHPGLAQRGRRHGIRAAGVAGVKVDRGTEKALGGGRWCVIPDVGPCTASNPQKRMGGLPERPRHGSENGVKAKTPRKPLK